MKTIVHHGGAGTTSTALKAGVPSVVVPFFADQSFLGNRVVKLGVSPVSIPKTQLTVNKLVNAIEMAISDPQIREIAANLGAVIRAENGNKMAAELISLFV